MLESEVIKRPIIPIFFAVDDNYSPYLSIALYSMIENASKEYHYKIYILIDKLSEENRQKLSSFACDYAEIKFVNVTDKLDRLGGKLHLRHYYTNTTYFRFFICDLFPQYDKGIYLDCDLAINGDISELYNVELDTKLLGASIEEVMEKVEVFGTYAEKVLDVPVEKYFSAGVLLMNLKRLREVNIEERFVEMLKWKTFRVTQDQDYLNVLCYDQIEYLDNTWNKTACTLVDLPARPKIIHYKINWKPWHYKGTCYEDIFWDYAKKTPYHKTLIECLKAYSDADKQRDSEQYEALRQFAIIDTNESINEVNRVSPLKFSIINDGRN